MSVTRVEFITEGQVPQSNNCSEGSATDSFCDVRSCKTCFNSCLRARSDALERILTGTPGTRKVDPIGVGVVDHEGRTHEVLACIFRDHPEFYSCGFFSSANEAIDALSDSTIHVLMVNVDLPDLCGIKCAWKLASLKLGLKKVLMLSLDNPIFLNLAAASGFHACLIKPFDFGQCLATLRFVSHDGGKQIHAAIPDSADLLQVNRARSNRIELTHREEDVLSCLSQGLSHKEIEDELRISKALLKKFLLRIYKKLDARNHVEAINAWRLLHFART